LANGRVVFIYEDHAVVAYAAGGKPSVGNIALRCRAHNGYEAELFYGPVREYGGMSGVRETRGAFTYSAGARCRVEDGRGGRRIGE